MERHLLEFLARSIGLHPATRGNFTSGGAEANQTAVIVALADRVSSYVESGIGEARPVIYVSSESHHSFHKAAVMAGIGTNAIRTIPVDSLFRMDVVALVKHITADRDRGNRPLMVVATPGTTSSGAIDPIAEIAEVCARENLWLHVDAAWGGSYLLIDELRSRYQSVLRADSLTWDAHKGLSVPMGAGMFFCRHARSVLRAFGAKTHYMPRAEEGTIDPYASTVQWSRRAIGLKVFFSLAALGREGYQRMLRHQTEIAELLRRQLTEKGWTIVNDTPLPLVCFSHPLLGEDAERHATFARRIQLRIALSRTFISTSPPLAVARVPSCITTGLLPGRCAGTTTTFGCKPGTSSAHPDQPIIVHMRRPLNRPNSGLTDREPCRLGRHELYNKTFGDSERDIRSRLDDVPGTAGLTIAWTFRS